MGLLAKMPMGNSAEYWLMLLDYDAVRVWIEKAGEIMARNDETEAERHLQDNAVRTGFPSAGHCVIPNNGVASLADLVVRDHVVGSKYYMDILRRQEDALTELQDMKAQLSALVGAKNAWREDLNDFARAAACGAVFREDDPFVYSYVSDAITEEREILTSAEVKPFGIDMPLYSAFLGYRNLSAEQKDAVTAAAQRQYRAGQDALKKANEALRAALVSAQSQMGAIKVSYPKEYPKIQDFFNNLKARVSGGGNFS